MNKFAGGRIKNKLQILSADSQQFLDSYRFFTDSQKEASSNPYQIIYVFSIDSQLLLSWIDFFFKSKWMTRMKGCTVSIFFTPLAPIFFMLPSIYERIRTLKWKVISNESFFWKGVIGRHQTFQREREKKCLLLHRI